MWPRSNKSNSCCDTVPNMQVSGTSRPGGRSERVRSNVLAATQELLAEGGYDALRVDDVATRAGVHKTTVYRRWPTKAALVMAVLDSRSAERVPVPDTGSLEGDLRQFARSIVGNLTTAGGPRLTRTLVTAADSSPELRSAAADVLGPAIRAGLGDGGASSGTRRGARTHRCRCPDRDTDRPALRPGAADRCRTRCASWPIESAHVAAAAARARRAGRSRVTPHGTIRVEDSGHGDQRDAMSGARSSTTTAASKVHISVSSSPPSPTAGRRCIWRPGASTSTTRRTG